MIWLSEFLGYETEEVAFLLIRHSIVATNALSKTTTLQSSATLVTPELVSIAKYILNWEAWIQGVFLLGQNTKNVFN